MDEATAAVRFVELCAADELWAGEMCAFEVGPHQVLLVNVDGAFHAYDGRCPHQRVPLAEGRLDGRTLVCRAHQWEFDIGTGHSVNPTGACLRRFPVQVADGRVFVGDAPLSNG
jgi:nitrite reductase/ring-hydroxylating ferredoxin subunit